MTTPAAPERQSRYDNRDKQRALSRFGRHIIRFRFARELLIVIAFCLFTSALTWPYVTRLRDAVVDTGDPYLMAWVLWWDYHATFTSPLHLFDSNLFYPLRYTLALSEHSYGIALLFFPLFALGLRPLTVHAIAMFFGFALSGYGAFRLGRTLTRSSAVGWVAGIVFAFVPYRFHMMSQVAYLFSPWIPLVFEALILFARERSRMRAAWLGCAFFMSGITTISWFNYSLIPLALYTAILLTRKALWRDRDFWRRGAVAIGTASLLLLPFMLPYAIVARLYGFKREFEEIKFYSAWPSHWLSVENRNRLWNRMGEPIPESWRFKLFPGLLPILFSLGSLPASRISTEQSDTPRLWETAENRQRWLRWLDGLIIAAFAISILAIGFDRTDAFRGLFRLVKSEHALAFLTVAVFVRLCVAYPSFLRQTNANFIGTLRSAQRSDGFWLGVLLTIVGFCYSLGWNFFFYRICYDLIPYFRSMRVASRGAMIAYLGLALLSGLGVKRLAESLHLRIPRLRTGAIILVACVLLLIELNAAPLRFMRGEVNPDAVTLRLKQTAMRGGLVELPAGGEFNDRYILRSADHEKPLIVGRSGFNSPVEDQIEALTRSGTIPEELMDLMEKVPTSYLVVVNQSIAPERKTDYQTFLAHEIVSGRLRFINRFDGHDDLYAVVKTEPDAKSEAPPPFDLSIPDWATRIREDPVNILGRPEWSQTLYRVYLTSSGAFPRYAEFIRALETIGTGIELGSNTQEQQFESRLRAFVENLTSSDTFKRNFNGLDDMQYVDRLLQNAGITSPLERQALAGGLRSGKETRADTLLKIVSDQRFGDQENYRSLVLLHYFGFLRRNPGDAPDHDLSGFSFWLKVLEQNHDPAKIALAFKESSEYQSLSRQH